MATYTQYNLILTALILPLSYALLRPPTRTTDMLTSARIGCLMILCAYPWDYFAITLGVWTYPRDPGQRLYGVPINDLSFIWLCTYLTCCALRSAARADARNGHAERKHTAKEHT